MTESDELIKIKTNPPTPQPYLLGIFGGSSKKVVLLYWNNRATIYLIGFALVRFTLLRFSDFRFSNWRAISWFIRVPTSPQCNYTSLSSGYEIIVLQKQQINQLWIETPSSMVSRREESSTFSPSVINCSSDPIRTAPLHSPIHYNNCIARPVGSRWNFRASVNFYRQRRRSEFAGILWSAPGKKEDVEGERG